MEEILLAFAMGFVVSHALSVIRISMFKNKIKLYETYVHDRLDKGTERLRGDLISH
ncbi:MAG: hypothetical protein M1423_05545 [Acidobacteria bacterium]|nr:hypothetical protein [Acidobacteriota bacterium]